MSCILRLSLASVKFWSLRSTALNLLPLIAITALNPIPVE